ncbi:MAG: hypothetical protein RR840_03295 [Clostridium sp.]
MKKYIKRSKSKTENIHLNYSDDLYIAKITFQKDENNIDPLYKLILTNNNLSITNEYVLGNFSPIRAYNTLNKIEINNNTIKVLPKPLKTSVYNMDEKYLKGYVFCF